MIEIKQLRVLSLIAETGSLTLAAQRMHLTQSALSHQLRDMEAQLGIALVNRGVRPLVLTAAGRLLTALADTVLPQVDATLERLRGLREGRSGRLALAGECHSCLEWVLPLLEGYRQRFPAVELDVVSSATLDPLPRLLDGRLDVVLTPDRRAVPGVVWYPLFEYRLCLAVAHDHRLAAHAYVEPADLAGETLLTYPVERSRLDVFTRFLWPAGLEPARVRTAESSALLVELAALAQGVAALPDWVVAAARSAGRIATPALGAQGLKATLWAALREGEADWPHLAGFVQLAQGIRPATSDAPPPG